MSSHTIVALFCISGVNSTGAAHADDQADPALRPDDRRKARKVRCRIGEAEDVVDLRDAERSHLRREIARVIDDSIGAELLDPLRRFRPRCGGNDAQAGELLRELDRDRSDAAGGTDQQHRLAAIRAVARDAETIEQALPTR